MRPRRPANPETWELGSKMPGNPETWTPGPQAARLPSRLVSRAPRRSRPPETRPGHEPGQTGKQERQGPRYQAAWETLAPRKPCGPGRLTTREPGSSRNLVSPGTRRPRNERTQGSRVMPAPTDQGSQGPGKTGNLETQAALASRDQAGEGPSAPGEQGPRKSSPPRATGLPGSRCIGHRKILVYGKLGTKVPRYLWQQDSWYPGR